MTDSCCLATSTLPSNPLDATNYFGFVCQIYVVQPKEFTPNISASKISKSAWKCRRVKRWIKQSKRKTDHKSKFGVITNQYFQACWRVIPISCREQQAQNVGWPDLKLRWLFNENQSERLVGKSGNIDSKQHRLLTNDQPFICYCFI